MRRSLTASRHAHLAPLAVGARRDERRLCSRAVMIAGRAHLRSGRLASGRVAGSPEGPSGLRITVWQRSGRRGLAVLLRLAHADAGLLGVGALSPVRLPRAHLLVRLLLHLPSRTRVCKAIEAQQQLPLPRCHRKADCRRHGRLHALGTLGTGIAAALPSYVEVPGLPIDMKASLPFADIELYLSPIPVHNLDALHGVLLAPTGPQRLGAQVCMLTLILTLPPQL